MTNFDRVREICSGWGLYQVSTELTQILYAVSEAGELAKSIAKNDREQARDDIGDVLVCLINAYELSGNENHLEDQVDFEIKQLDNLTAFGLLIEGFGSQIINNSFRYSGVAISIATIASNMLLTIDECLLQAISEIEKRKGKIVNGVFVKD
jgi:NTP pyrophosphatase (non-canonical NTP hydrolase)